MRRGETLDSIARKYDSNAKSILLANNMRRPSELAAGKVIRVPLNGCQPELTIPSRATKATPSDRETIEHVVQRGDSLWNIAKRYGTTADKIQQLNKAHAANLSVGQTLKVIPAVPAAASEPPKSRQRVYSVRKGDTLYAISQQHHMTLERLLTLNKLTARSKLQPGQKIVLD
jgi:membrane-bound lytic murein transglycosylase D